MRIGIVGSGMMGGTLGRLWARAGHDVLFASRHPDTLESLVGEVGANAQACTPDEAAARGEVVLLAIPYSATPSVGLALAASLAGKVLLDAGNPLPHRDGVVAVEARADGRGSGLYTASHFPSVRIVKAFNTVHYRTLGDAAHQGRDRLGIPLAGDDEEAIETARRLVVDAGFDPVVVGALARSADFDPGTAVWNSGMTAAQIRETLGLPL